jgi:hypothetical protein
VKSVRSTLCYEQQNAGAKNSENSENSGDRKFRESSGIKGDRDLNSWDRIYNYFTLSFKKRLKVRLLFM